MLPSFSRKILWSDLARDLVRVTTFSYRLRLTDHADTYLWDTSNHSYKPFNERKENFKNDEDDTEWKEICDFLITRSVMQSSFIVVL